MISSMKPGRFELSPELKQRLAKPYAIENHNEMELLTIQHELRQKNKEFRVLHERFQLLTRRFKEMVFNHEKLMEQMETVHGRNENLQKENVKLTSDLQSIKWESEKWKGNQINLEEIQQEKEELQKYIAHLEKILKGGEENPFQNPMELKRQIQLLKDERIKFEKESDQIRREQFIKIEELELKIKTLEAENRQLMSQFEEKNVKISQFSSSNLKLIHENKKLIEENKLLKSKVVPTNPALIEEIKKMRNDFRLLKDECETKDTENQALGEEIIDLKRIIRDLTMEKDEYMKKVKELSSRAPPEPSLPPPPKKIGNILRFSDVNNKFRIKFENFEIFKRNFPFSHPIPMLFSFGFYRFDSVFSSVIWPEKVNQFEYSQEFDVEMSDLFVCYVSNETIDVSLNVTTGERLREIGNFQIDLREILNRQEVRRSKISIIDIRNRNAQIGSVMMTFGMDRDIQSLVINKSDINKLSKL